MDTIIGASASILNDLTIPVVMGPVALITRGVGLGLFVLFFIAEACRLQMAAVSKAIDKGASSPRMAGFLWRAFLLAVSSAFLYKWIFMKMVSLCDHIAMLVSDERQWVSLVQMMTANSTTTVPFFHVTVPTFVGAVAMTALQYVEDIFTLIRYVILALLYAVGPIAWAFGLSELGQAAFRGWFKNTWQVSFWIVMFSLIKAAIIPLGLSALANGAASATVCSVVYAIVFVTLIFTIPMLTAAIFSEGNLGAITGAVTASIIPYAVLRDVASKGNSAHGVVFGEPKMKTVSDVARAAGSTAMGAARKVFGSSTPAASGQPEAPTRRTR